jgi:hypothetical protein
MVSAHSANAAPAAQCTGARIGRVSPLNLYSAGSFTCRGFAPETVVSLKPFSAAFRWLSSTASGTPARRKGLRMGIAIRCRGQHKAKSVTSGVVQWAGARCVEVERRISVWCRVRMNHDLIAGCRDPMRQARLAEVLGACIPGQLARTMKTSSRMQWQQSGITIRNHRASERFKGASAEESGRSNQPSAAVPLKHPLRTVPACDPGQEPTARRLRLRWPPLLYDSFIQPRGLDSIIVIRPKLCIVTTISQCIFSAAHARTLCRRVATHHARVRRPWMSGHSPHLCSRRLELTNPEYIQPRAR